MPAQLIVNYEVFALHIFSSLFFAVCCHPHFPSNFCCTKCRNLLFWKWWNHRQL